MKGKLFEVFLGFLAVLGFAMLVRCGGEYQLAPREWPPIVIDDAARLVKACYVVLDTSHVDNTGLAHYEQVNYEDGWDCLHSGKIRVIYPECGDGFPDGTPWPKELAGCCERGGWAACIDDAEAFRRGK